MKYSKNFDIQQILKIAKGAGNIAMKYYDKKYSIENKWDKSIITEVDLEINKYLIRKLNEFNYPILSEENLDDFSVNCDFDYMWIIDPLDGTKDFVQKTDDFSIMIGLINNTGEVVLGVIYIPMTNELFFAQKGDGAYLYIGDKKNKISVTEESIKCATILISRNHCGKFEKEVAIKFNMNQVFMGSAGVKMCRIANGEAELYINSSNKAGLWDLCAGDIILTEAGGRITDIHGKNVIYEPNKELFMKNGWISSSFYERNNLKCIV